MKPAQKTYKSLLVAAAENAAVLEKQARLQLDLLKYAAEDTSPLSIVGERKLHRIAEHYAITTKNRTAFEIASNLADKLLEDIMCMAQGVQPTLEIISPPERIQFWKRHNLLPTGSTSEMLRIMTILSEDGEENWQEAEKAVLRFGAAFLLNSLISNTLVPHCIYGVPERITTKVHLQSLCPDTVTIALNEHIPGLVAAVQKATTSNKTLKMLKKTCATGIQVFGVGSADEVVATKLPHLATLNGLGLALRTGGVDILLADPLKLSPTITETARCTKTAILTPHEVGHIQYTNSLKEDSATLTQLADAIVGHAISSFENRRDIKRLIPTNPVTAQVGFCKDSIDNYYGCMDIMASGLIEGKITGIVNLFGDAPDSEGAVKEFTNFIETLLENNILVFASGDTTIHNRPKLSLPLLRSLKFKVLGCIIK